MSRSAPRNPSETGLRSREAARLPLFAPAALGLGVWAHLGASAEPPQAWAWIALAVSLLLIVLSRALRAWAAPRVIAAALALAAAGYGLAGIRITTVAAPVMPLAVEQTTSAFSGRVLRVEASSSGRARLTLDHLEILGLGPGQTPERLRLTLEAPPGPEIRALLWRRVAATARLGPPLGPVEPGGFDPRFGAWFQGVGAYGFAENAPRDLGPAPADGLVERAVKTASMIRRDLAERARGTLPGETGALAAALLVGDRSGLATETVETLRAANLSHLLAISGLHMGLVCLTVFAAIRLPLALGESLAGRVEPKKLAALGAIAAGLVYLALSGGAIATWRAFAMAAVGFGAVLVGRPAVTLRAVALAALLILALAPESLFDIGFQLSFAATTAMVAAFETSRPLWRSRRRGAEGEGARARLTRSVTLWIAALVVSSAIAGLATAPFAAAAFHRAAPYGLAANILAMPLMGFWIMPMGVLALALSPLGLEAPALQAMGAGLDQVLAVATWVASWPGAERAVAAAAEACLPLLALGGLWLTLWRTPWLRLLGLAPIALAAVLWSTAERPVLLVAPEGRLAGVMGESGRALDRDSGAGFVAERWLAADGDPASQGDAAGRAGWERVKGGRVTAIEDWRVRLTFWPRLYARDRATLCDGPTLVIAPRAATEWIARDAPSDAIFASARSANASPSDPCLFYEKTRLAETGALALWRTPDGLRLVSSASEAGRRVWSDAALRAARASRAASVLSGERAAQ